VLMEETLGEVPLYMYSGSNPAIYGAFVGLICFPCWCYTTHLPVFLAGVVTRSNSDVGVDTAMSGITTLSRSRSVFSGVTFAIDTTGIDATTSISLFGKTRLNGLYEVYGAVSVSVSTCPL